MTLFTNIFKSLVLFSLLFVFSCKVSESPKSQAKVTLKLKEHSKEFKKGLIKVRDNVYVAIGFGLANSIMVEAPEGLIIIDTMESKEEAALVLKEFRKISKKPIKAIIYTHNHTDHIFGAEVFAEGSDIPVYAHETTRIYIERLVSVVKESITARSFRMFGVFLDQKGLENCGIGPRLGINEASTLAVIMPNREVKKELKVNIAGLDIELYHAPGETNDQIFVHIPKWKTIFPGDNFYRSFPNLYTIRGTPYRDILKWTKSLDHILSFEPEFLVPSHTRPLSGKQKIKEVLRDYRDAIQFVHDQTIRGINMGLSPDQLVHKVKLPSKLAASPFLAEYYGKVEWSVRSIFSGYLGWFDGISHSLHPLGFKARGKEFITALGGEQKTLAYVEKQFEADKLNWSLEVVDYILENYQDNKKAKELKQKVLKKLGEQENNANARHYYLSQAREIKLGEYDFFQPKPSKMMLAQFKLSSIFESLVVHLKAEEAKGIEKRVLFEFKDETKNK